MSISHFQKPRRCNRCGKISDNYYILRGKPDSYCKSCRMKLSSKSRRKRKELDILTQIARAESEIDFWRMLILTDKRRWQDLINFYYERHPTFPELSYNPFQVWVDKPNIYKEYLPKELLGFEKFCQKCKELKPLNEFLPAYHTLDKLSKTCNTCEEETRGEKEYISEKYDTEGKIIPSRDARETYPEVNTIRCILCCDLTDDILITSAGYVYPYCKECRNIRQSINSRKETVGQKIRNHLKIFDMSIDLPELFYGILFKRFFCCTHSLVEFQQLITHYPNKQFIEFNPPKYSQQTHITLYTRYSDVDRPQHNLITNPDYILKMYNFLK